MGIKERNFTYGQHQIDEVLVLNLESRRDRKWAAIGALDLAYTPLERVRIWNAIPASDFENLQQIGASAAADGFPWFVAYVKRCGFIRHPMIVAQAWSYCQMLRHIAESDITGLILYDDRYIIDFEQLASLNYWLTRIGYKFVQLDYYDNIEHLHMGFELKIHDKIPYLAEGPLGCSENAILYSPQGAMWTLNFLEANLTDKLERAGVNIETALTQISHLPREERTGIWTTYNCQPIYHNTRMGSDRQGEHPARIKGIKYENH